MKEITEKSETLSKYRKLKDKKYRDAYNLYFVEGVRMVQEAIKFRQQIDAVFVQKSKFEKFEGILKTIECEIFVVNDKAFNSISDTVNSQGIIAALVLNKRMLAEPLSNCLVLDKISDPGNLGTIIRTAAAFGYHDIYLNNCADPYNPKVVRSSMSGIFNVRLYDEKIEHIVKLLKDFGYLIYCADMNGKDIKNFKARDRFALCVGSEAFGIGDYLRKNCDAIISIPMSEDMESLNAAVCAGIFMYKLKE